jgi:hypothetical protein
MKTMLSTIGLATMLAHTMAFAQGNLTPPGPPAPTMKTLSQIEPRTLISSAPFTISASGSYYLTTNVTVSSGNAITVNANNVTLDLNGFTISSTETPAGSGAILLNAVTNTTILNGFISSGVTNNGGIYGGSGLGYGIYYAGQPPVNTRVSGISVSGCQYSGIFLAGNNSTVESCTVNGAGNYGIYAQSVSDSTAQNCGSTAVYANAANNCYGSVSGGGYGVNAVTANNCYGSSSSGSGLVATIANNCYGSSSSGSAVVANAANNCYGVSSSNSGVSASAANNCYGYSFGSGYGLYADYVAIGCWGESFAGTGLYAYNAAFCTGNGRTAIQATIANGCIALSGTNSVTYKYNMP